MLLLDFVAQGFGSSRKIGHTVEVGFRIRRAGLARSLPLELVGPSPLAEESLSAKEELVIVRTLVRTLRYAARIKVSVSHASSMLSCPR